MRRSFLTFSLVAGALMSGAAAAADLTQDDLVAPGLHFQITFGGSPQATPAPSLRVNGMTLNEAATEGASTGLSTGAWVAIGVVAVVVVVAVASHHGGGGGSSSGGGY